MRPRSSTRLCPFSNSENEGILFPSIFNRSFQSAPSSFRRFSVASMPFFKAFLYHSVAERIDLWTPFPC